MAINLNKMRGDGSFRFVVRPGDTLNSLCELLEVERHILRAANPDFNLDDLEPGMELIIPDVSTAQHEAPTEAASEEVGDQAKSVDAEKEAAYIAPDALAEEAEQAGEPNFLVLRVDEEETGPAEELAEDSSGTADSESKFYPAAQEEDRPEAPVEEARPTEDTQAALPRFEPVAWKPFPKV